MGVGSKIRELIDYYYSKKNEKNVVPINIPKNKSNLLENKVALIVGGTGGIGVAIAESFLEAGAKVIISGTSEEKVTKTVEKLGDAARGIQIDLNNVTEFDNKVSQAISLFPENRIDILVNCAQALPLQLVLEQLHYNNSIWNQFSCSSQCKRANSTF